MRPLELVVEGFRSFGQRTTFDWRNRRLIGIVGPIGSGKSSILDAIAFALYAKTPVFTSENKTLIKQGRDRARVELAFAVDGRSWRVVRVIRHKGASQHALYRTLDDEAKAHSEVADRERQVNERIEQLLGLDFSAFCRSVLLAQNRFAQFLTASPSERDTVLKGVFGFDRLDDMHRVARQRRHSAELETRELAGSLATLEKDRQRLAEAREEGLRSAQWASRLEQIEPEIRRLLAAEEEGQRQAKDAKRRCQQLDELASQVPAPTEMAKILIAGETISAQKQKAEAELQQARLAIDEAERALAETVAQGGSSEVHAHAERELAALRRAEELSRKRRSQRQAAAATLAASRQGFDEALQAKKQAEDQRQHLAEAASAAAAALAEAQAHVAAIRRQHGDDEAFEQTREKLRQLRPLRDSLEREQRDHRRLANRLAAADSELVAAEDALAQAQADQATAEERARATSAARQAAEEAVQRARSQEMALLLARTLRVAVPCPVCDQPVARLPLLQPSEALEAAEKEYAALCGEAEQADLVWRDLQQRAAVRQQEVAGARKKRAEARQDMADATARLATSEATCRDLDAEIATRLGSDQIASAEEKLAATVSARDAARQRLERGAERLRARQDELKDRAHNVELATERQRAAQAAVEEREKDVARSTAAASAAEDTVAAARAELAALLGDGDPSTLLVAARDRLAAADGKLTAARDDERHKAETVDRARAEADRARQDQDHLRGQLERLAGQLGLDGETDEFGDRSPRLLAQQVDETLRVERRAARRDEQQAEDRERKARETREDLLTSLGMAPGASFPDELAKARANRDADHQRAAELEAKLEQADQLQEKLDEATAHLELYRQLASDLTSSKFLRYLLDEERAALADLGSERFEMLSGGRYRFTADGSFAIVDLANAEAERKAETLSGGETFLASLALALALAEKVTGSGGRLDAFFLDEGFGQLDPEHLELALEGIERLVTDSPTRLVTVVSHVESMRDRIEDLIVLDKDPLTGDSIVVSGATADGKSTDSRERRPHDV